MSIKKNLTGFGAILLGVLLSTDAFSITKKEAARIGLDFVVNHSPGLLVDPTELKVYPPSKSKSKFSNVYSFMIANGYFNNEYHCSIDVRIDAVSGEVLMAGGLNGASKEWFCEFLADYNGN